MTTARDHHYIPRSILRGWRRPSEMKLMTCSVQDDGSIQIDRKGTPVGKFGSSEYLYRSSLSHGKPDLIERVFFGPLDKSIGDCVHRIVKKADAEVGSLPKDIISLAYRDPHHYKWLKILAASKLSEFILKNGPSETLPYTMAMLENFRLKKNGKIRRRECFSLLDVWLEYTLRDAWMWALPVRKRSGYLCKVFTFEEEVLLLPDYPVFYFPESKLFGGSSAQMSALSPKHLLVAGCENFIAGVHSLGEEGLVDLWNEISMGFVRKKLIIPSKRVFDEYAHLWREPLKFNDVFLGFKEDPGPHDVSEYLLDRIPELTDIDISGSLPIAHFDAQEMIGDAEYVQHIVSGPSGGGGSLIDFALKASMPYSPSSAFV